MFFAFIGDNPILEPVIEIYKLEDTKIIKIFSEYPPWAFENAVWENDTDIGMEAFRYNRTDSGQQENIRGKAKIQFINGEWQIIQPEFYKKMSNVGEWKV